MKTKNFVGKAAALLLTATLLICSVALIAGASGVEPGSKGEIDVYLIVGQSNAVGFGSDELSYSFKDPRYTEGFDDVLFFGKYGSDYNPDKFVPVTVGLGRVNNANGNTKTVGAEIGMAAALSGNGRKSAIIKSAYGSSFLYPDTANSVSKENGTWTSPTYIKNNGINTENTKIGALYNELLSTVGQGIGMLKNDGYIPVIKGVWYMQGEAETSEKAHADKYAELLRDFINDLRSDLTSLTGTDCSSLPFVCGRITRNPTYDARPYLDAVNAAQDAVASTLSKVAVVETGGLAQLDGWHYSADAQHLIGERFISSVIAMDGKFGVGIEATNVTAEGAGAKAAGETVTVTFTPYEGCILESVTMKVGNTVTDITADVVDGTYTFTMPEANVTFTASATDPNSISTEYGVIPSWFSDPLKYPFVVFKDGSLAGTASEWHEAVKLATMIARGPRAEGNDVQILLRASAHSVNMCNDIAFIGGTLTVDLNGYTLISQDKQLFNLIGKSTDGASHATRVVVKNGVMLAKKPILAFNNSAEAAYVTRKDFTVDFYNVTFGFSAYTSQMLVTSYDDGTVGINANVTLNDCDINFNSFVFDGENNSYALAGNTTVFKLSESTNKNNINVVMKGGNVSFADSTEYVTFSSLGAKNEWGQDSFVFAKDENGNYTTFTSNTSLTGRAVFKTDDGKSVEYVASGEGYTLAEVSADRLTKYGAIPASANAAHPFVLFQDGAFVATYDTWYNFLGAAGSIDWAKETTLLLRDNYSTTTCGEHSSNLYLVGDLTIDLGGNTFTRGKYHMFQAIRKSDEARQTNITVKNGTLKIEKRNSSLICYNSDGSLAKDASVLISFNFLFDGINITADNEKVVESGDKTYVGYSGKMICDAYGDGTVGTENTVTLNNCVIEVPNTSISGLFSTNDTDKDNQAEYNKHKITVKINGGHIEGEALNSKFAVAVIGEGDSIVFGKGSDGKEFYARLKAGAANPTGSFVSEGKTLYLVESAKDESYSYYYPRSLETAYGTVSTSNISAVKYPFVLFDTAKKQIATYATWKDAITAHPTGYLVMRRDYSTAECGGLASNFYLCNDLVIDLGGFTISQPASGGNVIFPLRRVNNNAFSATVTVKNGTVLVSQNWNAAIIIRNTNSATDTSMAKPKFHFTFDSVTFTSTEAYQGRIVLEVQDINALGGTDSTFIFNNCTFEKNTTSNHPLFRLKEADGNKAEPNEKHDVKVIVNGGKVVNNTSVAVILASFSDVNSETGRSADSLTFGKLGGSYFKYVLPLGTAASTYTHVPTDSSVTLSLADVSNGENTIYLLGEDGYLQGYGKLPFTYADAEKYPFVAYKNGVCTAGLTNWASNSDTADNITSAIYYATRNKDATIVLRRNYTATSDSYNNVAHILNATFDLGGFTFTTGDNAMIQAMAKTNGSAGVLDTVINIKNGTILVTKTAVIVFNHANFDTYTTPEKWFIGFDGVTFGFANGSSANGLVASTLQFASTGNIGSLPTVTLNDCVFNAKSGTPIFNLNDSKDLVNATVIVNGGTVNAASLSANDLFVGTSKDKLEFAKQNGSYTLFAISDKASYPTAVINGGKMVFAKHSETEAACVYTLISKAVSEFAPMSSVTLYTDFGYNIYIPSELVSAICLDGEYLELSSVLTAELNGKDHYKLTVRLNSYEALRDITLAVTLNSDGETFVGSYTFNLMKYASYILKGEYSEEEKALSRDMLSYVKAAYTYWDIDSDLIGNIDALIGEKYNESSIPDMSVAPKTPTESKFTKVTFHLGEAPAYRFYYEGDTAPEYTYKAGSGVLEATLGKDSFGNYVEVKTYAYEILGGISFTDGRATYEYNVYSYYAWANANGMSAEAALIERLVKYCESAYEYGKTVNA